MPTLSNYQHDIIAPNLTENVQADVPELIKNLGYQYATETSKRQEIFGIFICRYRGCKNEFRAMINNVKRGKVKSCGCRRRIRSSEVHRMHGLGRTRLYGEWHNMKRRCYDTKTSFYHLYGGNGVTVCDEWRNDFMAFRLWALNNGYADNLTLNRIKGNKSYSPSTCNWVDRSYQCQDTILLKSNNKSGYRGVTWNKRRKKWDAYIGLYNKHYYLGNYTDKIDAAKAYNKFIIEHGTHHPLNPV